MNHTSTTTANGAPRTVPEAARWCLGRGYAPIPLPPRSKQPTLADWPNLRVPEADVDRLFAPDGNIGVLLGVPSRGLVDVDLDCPEAIRAAPVLLPPTGMLSGRRSAPRAHWWYRADDPPARAAEVFDDPTPGGGDERRRLAELRSSGGQTMIPPSTHPSGERCVWHGHGEPARVSIDVLQAAVRGVSAAALLGRHWPSGSRHDASLALAGALLRAGWPDEMVERFVRAVCAAARDEEVEDRVRAVQATADKLRRDDRTTGWPTLVRMLGAGGEIIVGRLREWLGVSGPAGPRVTSGRAAARDPSAAIGWEPPVPLPELSTAPQFPLHLFPPAVADYWRASAEALHVPVDYVGGPGISVLGAAVGRSRAAEVKPGYAESPLFWVATIAPSGSAKSTSLRSARAPLDREESRWRKEHAAAVEEFDAEVGRYEHALKEWKKNPTGDPPEKPRRPTLRQSVLDDATVEGARKVLRENPRGVVLLQDELIGFARMLNQYKTGGKGNDKTFWLTGWNGRGVGKSNRSKDHEEGPQVVIDPFTAVGGMLCPDSLPELREELQRGGPTHDGWCERFLFQYPDPLDAVEETWAVVPEGLEAGYREVVLGLLALEMVLVDDPAREATYRPFYVRFDDGGRGAWSAFTREVAARMNALPKTDAYRGVLSKLRHYGLRFACLFHSLDLVTGAADGASLIGADCMRRAAEMVWYFEGHARRCLGIGDRATDPARRLLDVLAGWGGDHFTKRELHRRVRGQTAFRRADNLNAPLDLLVQHGYVAPAPDRPQGPGRPPERFEINPLWDRGPDGGMDDMDRTPKPPGNPGVPSPSPGRGQNPPGVDETPRGGVGGVNSVHAGGVSSMPGQGVENPSTLGEKASSVHFGYAPQGEEGTTLARLEGPPPQPEAGHSLVTSLAGLGAVVAAIEDSGGPVGLDTETTGLNAATDRARLLALATPKGTFLIDLFRMDSAALIELFGALARVEVVGHNLAFDLPFLMRLGLTPGRVRDTMLASQVLHAGNLTTRHALKDVAARTLDLTLDKVLQAADWSRPLTPEMLRYAALDAEVPVRAWERLAGEANVAGMSGVLDTEMGALPCVAWAAVHGVGFDRAGWESLALDAESRRDVLREQLDTLAPNAGDLFGTRNWDSPEQVKEAFASVGITLDSTDDDALAAVGHSLAATLRDYRSAARLATAYGRDWLRHAGPDGRVYAAWKQVGAGSSGRMSCSGPNLQQLPRDQRYRRCFVAPPGRVLVKADYSQIELRIAAKIAGERRMLDAYRAGEDLHILTARSLLGKSEVTKADRQLAKAVNFGLLYGQGARGLMRYALANYGVALTEAEAGLYREKFFATYPGLRRWHRSVGDAAIDTRTLAGRLRRNVTRFTEKLNTPVQGTGADGLKRATALLWERRGECPGAFPVLFVHDEVVVEAPADAADSAAVWLKEAMLDGMAPLVDPVPVEVEATIGQTWGG
jgi:DNA polymerase-1